MDLIEYEPLKRFFFFLFLLFRCFCRKAQYTHTYRPKEECWDSVALCFEYMGRFSWCGFLLNWKWQQQNATQMYVHVCIMCALEWIDFLISTVALHFFSLRNRVFSCNLYYSSELFRARRCRRCPKLSKSDNIWWRCNHFRVKNLCFLCTSNAACQIFFHSSHNFSLFFRQSL